MSTPIKKEEYSNDYDDITYGTYFVKGNLGGYIYKSYESITGRNAKYKDHIKSLVEANNGAHYYVQGPYTTKYSKASGTINLSNVSVSGSRRSAYISMGIITCGTNFSSVDIGLINKNGAGWQPAIVATSDNGTAWEVDEFSPSTIKQFSDFRVSKYSNVKYCTIDIEVSKSNGYDVLVCTYTYKNSAGTTIATCKVTYRKKAGTLYESGYSKPAVRFTRFISLVPTNEGGICDDADESYLNAGISDLKLNSSNWTASQIDYAWSVQGLNITELKISTFVSGNASNADSIKIKHHYQLH